MLTRIGIAVLVLALVAGATTAFAAPTDVEGAKAAEPHTDETAAPASSQVGMILMTLLLLSASSAAMLGGGVWHRVLSGRAHVSVGAETHELRGQRSPKNKSKRMFARGRASRGSQGRRGGSVSLRRANEHKPRRRGGPGCRGVR